MELTEMTVEFATSVEFQMSLLLSVALAGYLIASRLGWSVVVGEIFAGVVMGPSLLCLITYSEFVKELATMGAIFLLFVIGLKTKFKEVYTINAVVIALFGVVLPWLGGYALAVVFGYNTVNAMFVGTALTATSIAITAYVLKEMGKLETPAAKTIIGAAVVDDVLGLLALSLTSQFVVHEMSIPEISGTVIAAVSFIFLGVAVGTMFLSKQLEKFNKWAEKQGIPQATFIAAMAIAFAYSLIAEQIGLSAIVGAFVAGVSLESLRIKSYREGAAYLEIIFAAIFFVSLGVLVDLKAFAGGAWLFLALLTVVAVVTKAVGCFVPARLLGMKPKDAAIVGVGMVPRGEIAMVVALYGLSTGFIGQEIYSSIIFLGFFTTIATPVLIKRLYFNGRQRKRIKRQQR